MFANLLDELTEFMERCGITMDDVDRVIVWRRGEEPPVRIDKKRFLELASETIYNPDYGDADLMDIHLIGKEFMVYLREYDGSQKWDVMPLDGDEGDPENLYLDRDDNPGREYDTKGNQWHRRPYTLGEVAEKVRPIAEELGVGYVDLVFTDKTDRDAVLDVIELTYERERTEWMWLDEDPFEKALYQAFGVNIRVISPHCNMAKWKGFHGTRIYGKNDGSADIGDGRKRWGRTWGSPHDTLQK